MTSRQGIVFKLLLVVIGPLAPVIGHAREVGDVVFRKPPIWGNGHYFFDEQHRVGHAMIYAGRDEDGVDWILHAPGGTFTDPKVSQMSELELEPDKTNFRFYPGTTRAQRRKIVSFANSKLDLPYSFPGKYFFLFIDIPNLAQQKGREPFKPYGEEEEGETYTCAGFVERAYEESGINLTPDGFGRDLDREENELYRIWNENEGSWVCHPTPTTELCGWVLFPYAQESKQTHWE